MFSHLELSTTYSKATNLTKETSILVATVPSFQWHQVNLQDIPWLLFKPVEPYLSTLRHKVCQSPLCDLLFI